MTTWVLQWLRVRHLLFLTALESMVETLLESRASTIQLADLDHTEQTSVFAAAAAESFATVRHWPTLSGTAVEVESTGEVMANAFSPMTLGQGTACIGRLG